MSAALTQRLLPKISPSLLLLAEENKVRLAALRITGSLNTTFLGISSQSTSWAETEHAYNAILADRIKEPGLMPWFLRMFSIPSLNLRNLGGKTVLTTDVAGSFLTRATDKSSMDFSAYQVRLGLDPRHAYMKSFSPGWINTISVVDVATPQYDSFKYILETLGLQPVSTGKCFFHPVTNTGVSNLGALTFESTKNAVELSQPINWGSNGLGALKDWNDSAAPGQKMCQIYVRSSGDAIHKQFFDWITSFGGSPDWQYPVLFGLTIPYVDDGSSRVPVVFVDGERVYIHFAKDRRYGGGSSVYDISSSRSGLSRIANGDGEVPDVEGKMTAIADLPLSGFGSKRMGDFHFLPYLCAPLRDMHLVLTSFTKTTETFESRAGFNVEVDVYECASELFCTKVDKAWYAEYHESGFGLFAPKPVKQRQAIIKAVNDLDFETMGICLDNSSSVISPDIVYQTDLAASYKRAREKACKDNDWLEQKFVGDITYRQIRNQIVREPLAKAFYCVAGASDSRTFSPKKEFESIVWSFVNASDEVVAIKSEIVAVLRKDSQDDSVERYSINATARDLMLAEYGGGASISIATFKDVFDVGAQDALEIDNYSSYENELRYTDTKHQFNGVRLAYQFYTPEESLSLNGYPLFRYMASPYKEAMVLRMYADFKKIGDGFVRIINTFLTEAVVLKLLKEQV